MTHFDRKQLSFDTKELSLESKDLEMILSDDILSEIIKKDEKFLDANKQFSELRWYLVIEQMIEIEDLDENLDPHVKAQKLMKGICFLLT